MIAPKKNWKTPRNFPASNWYLALKLVFLPDFRAQCPELPENRSPSAFSGGILIKNGKVKSEFLILACPAALPDKSRDAQMDCAVSRGVASAASQSSFLALQPCSCFIHSPSTPQILVLFQPNYVFFFLNPAPSEASCPYLGE